METSGQGSENARKVKNGKCKPDWAKSKAYHQKDGKKVIEVQFDFEEIAIPEHLKTEKLEKNSVLQTLILFPQSDGSYVPYFLNIYPDSPDKKFKLKDFIDGGYQKIPKDFSGVYRFYRWNGDFISGWRIKDGVKTHRIKESKDANKNDDSARISNFTVYCYEIVTTWYQMSCSEGFGCTTPIALGTTTSGVESRLYMAPPSTNPGSGGGGGGGGTPPNTGENCEMPEGNLEGVTVECGEDWDEDKAVEKIEQLYGAVNECEKSFIRSNFLKINSIITVFNNSVIADLTTRSVYGYVNTTDGWNNCADAFRHTYWNALNVISVPGYIAEGLATAHECSGYNHLEKDMDLRNNEIGRTIGYGHLHLNISNEYDLNVLKNAILIHLALGDSWIIFPRALNNSVLLTSSVVSSINHCN